MRILLIRHAEPDYSVDSLTPKGHIEAELLSRRLVHCDVKDFYVSPLGRARHTAAYTLEKLGRTAEVLPWLAEFRGRCVNPETGRKGLPWDLPPRLWSAVPGAHDVNTWTDAPLFAGSDVGSVWKETANGANELLGRYGFRKDGPVWHSDNNRRETIVLFCHFGISMAFAGWLMDLSPLMLWHRMLTLPSSVTELITEERIPGEVSFRITRLGDISHLESAGEKRSTAGLFPECFTGTDSTDPAVNGTLGTEYIY